MHPYFPAVNWRTTVLRNRRTSLRRAVASVLTGALIASAALVGIAAPASAADAPSVTAPAVPRAGGTISVSGAGFSTDGFGIYLGVRQNGSSSDSYTVWIDDTNTLGEIPGMGATAPMNGDGSFSVAVPVSAYADGIAYSIVTRKAHGGVDPTQSTTTPLTYEAAPATTTTTTLAVSPSGPSEAGATISLTATVAPASTGSVSFLSSGTELASVPVNAGTATYTVTDPAAGSYSFTAAFTPEQGAHVAGSTSSAVAHTVNAPVVIDPEVPTPTVVVSKTTGLDAAGDTVTVTGTGFVANAPATNGVGRPPSGFGGAYVVFGSFLTDWKPTSGAPSSARKIITQKWGVAAADMAAIGGSTGGAIEITPEGTFTTTLSVSEATALANGNWGVYTYAGGGAQYAPFETYTPITFAQPVPVPTLSVSQVSGLDAGGASITVTGENYSTAGVALYGDSAGLPAGVYAQIGWLADNWRPSEGAMSSARTSAYSVWVQGVNTTPPYLKWTDNEDGTADFVWQVTIDKATLDAKKLEGATLSVFTVGAGGVVQAANELSTAISFAEQATAPAVIVTPNADLDPAVENIVTVTGKNFVGTGAAYGAYVLFGETSVWSGGSALPGNGWIAMKWASAADITDGAFTTTLTIPAGTLDPTKSYQVATSAAHQLSATDRSLDTFTPVSVADPVSTEPTIFLSAASVPQGGMLEVRGTGFPVGEFVTVTVNSDPITLGSGLVGGSGSFVVSGTIPRTFAAGSHTVIAAVGEVRAESALIVTAAAAIPADETPAIATCVARAVSGATLQWNVKESFRTYVEGPIAKGSYSIGWGSGSGAFSTETERGRVGFGGSATFTGHGGLLDLTISNPRIQITSATSASLIVNVTSKGFNGTPDVSQSGVVFATLSLPAATENAGRIRWSGASATLTEAGAAAFAGFYEAGAALDPVSVTLPLGAEVPCDSSTTGDLAATGGEASLDVLWLGLGMLVLGAGIWVMRRKVARV